jgi:hypothetical protein
VPATSVARADLPKSLLLKIFEILSFIGMPPQLHPDKGTGIAKSSALNTRELEAALEFTAWLIPPVQAGMNQINAELYTLQTGVENKGASESIPIEWGFGAISGRQCADVLPEKRH